MLIAIHQSKKSSRIADQIRPVTKLYRLRMETQKTHTIGQLYARISHASGRKLIEAQGKKGFVMLAGMVAVVNSTLGSSLPSGAITYIGQYFHVTDEIQLVLPITLFLVGYIFGPLFFGPLSETYGRRVITLSSFTVYTLFTMACALAPNWPAFLAFRLLCGVNASSPIAIVGGLYADIFAEPVIRGRAMAIFMAVRLPDLNFENIQLTSIRLQCVVPKSHRSYRDLSLLPPGAGLSGLVL